MTGLFSKIYAYFSAVDDKIYQETLWSFASKGISFLMYYALIYYLSTMLGPQKWGIWSLFFSTFTILVTVLGFGVSSSAKNYAAKYYEKPEFRQFLFIAIGIQSLATIVAVSVIVLLTTMVPGLISELVGNSLVPGLLLLAVPLFVAHQFVYLLKNLFKGSHEIKKLFQITISEHGFKLLFVLLLPIAGSVRSVLWAFTLAMIITLIVGMIIIYQSGWISLNKLSSRINRDQLFDLATEVSTYSVPLLFISIGFLLMTEVDILMLGALASEEEVGNYALAKRVIVKLPHISTAIALGTMPVFANITQKNRDDRQVLLKKVLVVNTVSFGSIFVAIVLLAPLVVPMLFGDQYVEAVLPMQILGLYAVMMSFSTYFSQILDYQGLARIRAGITIITVFLNISLNLILIPQYGPTGAAIATILSYLPYFVISIYYVYRVLY